MTGLRLNPDPYAEITARGREVLITAAPWLADPTGVRDAAAAFRAARNYLVSVGGGVIRMPPRSTFNLASTETILTWEINAQVSRTTCLALPAGVSLIGAGRQTTKLVRSTGGVSAAIITPLDPANQKFGGFELQGAGGSSNSAHAIFGYSTASYAHVMENVEYFDLYLHDVGSYGLGNNLECKNVRVRDIKTRRTGADGIDWKQRSTGLSVFGGHATYFTGIDIDEFGQRSGAGTPTGVGFRGLVHVDGISVKGIPSDIAGIDFTAGIVTPGDIRVSASMSTITNWYCEGADPKGNAIGISIFSCAAVRVGPGLSKWARCEGKSRTTTPYGFDDGGLFEGATVIPAHGRTAFLATAKSTHFRGARVISDKVYWDAKRGNLTAGQTLLPLPFSSAMNNATPRFMVKINGSGVRTILTATVDFNWNPNSVTLLAPAAADDVYFAVFPPQYGFRIEANNCSVMGVQDYFVPSRMSIPLQQYADSGEFHIMWEGRANVGQINSDTNMGLFARDPGVADSNLLAQAQGAGAVKIGSSGNKLSYFSAPGALRQAVTGATAEEKIDSLIAALAAYGEILDSTT